MNVPSSAELYRLVRNLRAEHDGAALYDALADLEADPRQSCVYRQLARWHSANGYRSLMRESSS
jgi:hypothetical protein